MTQTDMAEAMAEIRKVDPYFSKEAFVKECEFDIIPTVLEVCEGEGGRVGGVVRISVSVCTDMNTYMWVHVLW